MADNYRWNHPDGAGGFIPMNFATSAEAVSYGSSTVKDALDDFNESSGASSFMKTLLNAADATAARKILRVSREDFFDETGGRWDAISAILSAEESKFGTSSYYGSGSTSYLSKGAGITLGGKDFSISCWINSPAASTKSRYVFSWGNSATRIIVGQSSSNKFVWLHTANSSSVFSQTFTAVPTGSWQHIEIDYRNSDNKLFFFLNGSKVDEQTASALGTALTMPFIIGANVNDTSLAFQGYIDEFLITEKLLHTADFTVPTLPYLLDSSTISLLHFGLDEIIDNIGSTWQNYGATFSTAQKKFGGKSLYVDGTFLQRSTAVTLGGGDFAIAGWFYAPATTTAVQYLFGWGNSETRFVLARSAENKIYWYFSVNSTAILGSGSVTSTEFSLNGWNHVEVDYNNSDKIIYLFFNGVKISERNITDFSTARTLPCCLGSNPANTSATFKGYIDEFLITEKLLHDDDFTPPTTTYTADSSTIALLHFE